jgi:1-acyl-sn-glycerol-3-phosphate acyltransferase
VRTVRASLRLVLLLIVSLLAGLAVGLARLLLLPFGRRAFGLSLRWATRVQQVWAKLLMLVLGVRVRRPPGRPPSGCMIASNHLGYIDVPVLASVLPCRLVSKAEVRQWPLMGVLAQLAHVLFLDRGRKREVLAVGTAIRETLEAGVTVAFFPEGTSTRGERVAPFHPGLLEPAASLDIPCLAFALHYEAPGDPEAPACTICFWGDVTFLGHAWKLLKLRRIDATVRWSDAPVHSADRKELARELHARVSEMFVPVRQPEAGCGAARSETARSGTPGTGTP